MAVLRHHLLLVNQVDAAVEALLETLVVQEQLDKDLQEALLRVTQVTHQVEAVEPLL